MKRWFLTVLLQLDTLVSALTGGYADETISYRFARAAAKGLAIGCIGCKIMEFFVPNHCDLNKPPKADALARPGGEQVDLRGSV